MSDFDSELPPLDVICEDGPVIAVNKPHGVISQGAPRGVTSLVDQVKAYLQKKYNKPGNVYLGVPHRIDRPVSGVVVFSRNSKCAARLSEQFAQREVKKVYRAVLERIPDQPAGKLEDWIYRIPDHSRVEISSEKNSEAKFSHLTYQVLKTGNGRALVEIELGTGRMHQIRVQFGSRGWPIIGDEQYGASGMFPGFSDVDRTAAPIALHARSLTLKHPVRYDEMTITAALPRLWNRLGLGNLE
ncbi:RluA family pseudouridine synthase [Planctomicrobium sp. SH664]|uniref:RluA family pseudouridine synthase n=1 Tax=Planctomicrobium sp. SH664 TaxID=3448125 RepID=UPI003F5BF178